MGHLLPVRCGNKIIDLSNKTKFLGVSIDHKLSWKEHVDKVHKSCSNQIRVLRKLSYRPSRLLKKIYFETYVATNLGHLGIPHMTYCISSVSVSMVTEMESLQRCLSEQNYS